MKLISCTKNIFFRIVFLFFIFLLPSFSIAESCSKSNYDDLNFIDLVTNKEDCVHNERVKILNRKINDREDEIEFYTKKVRLTKQAINNLKIEIDSYNSLMENITNKINNVNQLNGVLNDFEQQIKSVELEFEKVKRVSEGLENISKSEFMRLKKEGYFSSSSWLDYAEIVQEVIEYKQEVDKEIKSQKSYIKYAKKHPTKVLGKIAKWGVKKALRSLIPPLAILDGIETLYSIGKWLFN